MILALLAALLCIAGAIGAVAARNLMRGAFSLSLFFLGVAGLFGSLGAGFLAVAQLFLFVGGVALFLVLAFASTTLPVTHSHLFTTIGVALLGALAAVAFLPPLTTVPVPLQPSAIADLLFGPSLPALVVVFLTLLSGVIVSRALVVEDDS